MKAYEVIEKPESWTKGTLARDKNGLAVSWESSRATCFCVNGALARAYVLENGAAYINACRILTEKLDVPHWWNDAPERTHAEVYNLLKTLDI